MGTEALAFANFVIICQVMSVVHSAYPDWPQLQRWNAAENDGQGAANKNYYFMQEMKPMNEGGVNIAPNYINLDDINELQLPPPPTQKDTLSEASFDDNNAENGIQGSSKYYSPTDRNNLSGAGALETNEIVKNLKPLPKTGSLSISSNNNDDKYYETKKEGAPVANKLYNYPELDEAVENLVNNLLSSNDSPLVPLIKVFNQRNHEKSSDENINEEDLATKRFLQKNIILNLDKKVQKQREDHESESQNIQESVVLEQQDNTSQVENRNEANEENQPCDCEGRCDEETPQDETEKEKPGCDEETAPQEQTKPEKGGFGKETPKYKTVPENTGCGEETAQDQTETEETSEQGSQLGHHDNQNTNIHPKGFAHVIIMLRRLKTEEKNTIQNPPLTPFSPFGNEQPYQPRKNPTLSDIFLTVNTKSNSINIIPPSSSLKHVGDLPAEKLITEMSNGGCGDNSNENESDRENNRYSFPREQSNENEDESSEYTKRSSFTRYASDDQDLSFQSTKRLQYRQKLLKEFILSKVLNNIMKQKAAANALRERQEKQFFPLTSFEELSNTPSPTSGLVIIRPSNELTPPHLPPLYFPGESSGYKVKHLDDSREFPIFRELKHADLENESVPITGVKTFNNNQEDANSDAFGQQNSTPQEIPWFIKNILSNLTRQPGRDSLQPIPTPFIPLQKPAEEKNPVLLRALLAPFSL